MAAWDGERRFVARGREADGELVTRGRVRRARSVRSFGPTMVNSHAVTIVRRTSGFYSPFRVRYGVAMLQPCDGD